MKTHPSNSEEDNLVALNSRERTKFPQSASIVRSLLKTAARSERMGVVVTRVALIVVLSWIGGLKACQYEAQSIVPFVANSPLMRFFYAAPRDYKQHMNREGEAVSSNIAWHAANHTYIFSRLLGAVIVFYALLLCCHWRAPGLAALGGFLVFTMSLVTLSFLVTTPECWVPALGDPRHGFPFLGGPGRLVVKDLIMMGAALVVMTDSAKAALAKSPGHAS